MRKELKVYTFDEIDSTNSEAKRQVLNGVTMPSLFVADRQTMGRGRRGKSFFSKGGLYMTLAADVGWSAEQTVKITTIAAVAVAKAIEKLTDQEVGIKWVNDIYLKGRKICGILAEAVYDNDGRIKVVIIGVGVNLNVKGFPDDISDIAGSLICPTLDKMVLAEEISHRILDIIENNSDYMEYYKARSVVLGKPIAFLKNNVWYDGVATDINDAGELVVMCDNGKTEILSSGEISLRLK